MTEWKVVPLEATEEMLRAGAALLCSPDDADDIKWQREEWAAMVAASPEVQASFLLSTIRAQARMEALEEVASVIREWGRPDAIRLAAGELTAQEMRTARAVLSGIESRIRALIEKGPAPNDEAYTPFGADRPELNAAFIKWKAAFDALSPEEQAEHRQAQKESWVRAEMRMDRAKAINSPSRPDPATRAEPVRAG